MNEQNQTSASVPRKPESRKRCFPVLRCAVFLAVLAAVVIGLQSVFIMDLDRGYDHIANFYDEKPGTMDVIMVGASEVNATWQPPIGWREYGIAVWDFAIDTLPPRAVRIMIDEARKRQPQAVVLISLNPFKLELDKYSVDKIHRAVDFLPLCKTKIDLVNAMTGKYYSLSEKLEFLFPIIRFHSRWDSLKGPAFGEKHEDFKGAMRTVTFRQKIYSVAGTYHVSYEESEAPDEVKATMIELLDYLDRNGVRATFVKFPQDLDDDQLGRMNQIQKIAEERGYPVLDLLEMAEELNIDFGNDFYNARHLNIHGSLKAMEEIASYLKDTYGLGNRQVQAQQSEDPQTRKQWESWDTAADNYLAYIRPYVLPFELEHPDRAALSAPKLKKASAKGRAITVSWNESDGADGYAVYRSAGKKWEYAGETDYTALEYTDTGLKPSTKYTYRVVPFRYGLVDGEKQYGHFDAAGISAKTAKK